MNKQPERVVLCSSVAVDYFLFLSRCVGATPGEVRLVHALDEVRYRKLAAGGRLARLWMRCVMYILYPLRLAKTALFARRGSLVVVTSNTFFAPALVAMLGRLRGIKVIHLLYDLFPDALEVAGSMRRDGLMSRLLGVVARANLRWPAGVVFLGERLRNHAVRRWGMPKRDAVIDISTDTRLYPAECSALPQTPLEIHYGGQLGAMHDAEALAAAVRNCVEEIPADGRVRFSFAISGSRARRFSALVKECGVETRGTIPSKDWRAMAVGMHIGLVTLSAGGATVCLPSKTYAMMASGMAIVAICPVWSDLANLILENDAGWVIDNSPGSNPDNPVSFVVADERARQEQVARGFAVAIREALLQPAVLEQKRRNAHRAAHGRFGVRAIEQRWADYFASMEK